MSIYRHLLHFFLLLWKRQVLLLPFKASHVTRRPSLKRLSGMQVQLLSLCMEKHKILPNCSLNLPLNVTFEITNDIRQQLYHKCCFFCSNSVIKSLFLRRDQPEGGASCDWSAILSVTLFPIQNYTSDTSCVFYSLCLLSLDSCQKGT